MPDIEITVEFNEDSEPQIEVLNGDGIKCLESTKKLEEALGVVESRSMKPGAIAPRTTVQNRAQRQQQR